MDESRLLSAFAAACALGPEERKDYVREIEREEPALGQRLRVLLKADKEVNDALDGGMPTGVLSEALCHAAEAPPEAAPQRIGPYRVLRSLGQGGMGQVFLAWQEEPIQREVALKVMRAGMESDEIRQRFQQETEALALLDHPHIARVLDAGMAEGGHPFLAMEVIDGEPLIGHCERAGLDIDARLALFIEVCRAIEHAHQKGIIHRDLKPSNVLVTESAGCKVIDFGIAKRTGAQDSEANLLTSQGQLLGTPAYMSPEQAGSSADVDTRTDVYSLGVLLYELLVGRRPADAGLARATSLLAMLRVVREEEPARPSTLRSELAPELDWITLRALEKDREHRYRSPAALANDVEHFLRLEPVSVGPPGTGYRLRKFVRRNRGSVTAAGAVLLALLAVLGLTSSFFFEAARAERSEHEANDDLRRLADLDLLREAEREAEALWPVGPDRLQALRSWLESYAEPLGERRNVHRARLQALRAQLPPLTAAERERERATHPLTEELSTARLLAEFARRRQLERPHEVLARAAQLAAAEVIRLERELGRRRTWRFEERRDQWEHDTLVELAHELERFFAPDPRQGTVASIERRIADAERMAAVHRREMEAGTWRSAVELIRTSPRYGGLELEPEPGMVPLGPDPHSGLWEFWHVSSGERPRPSLDPGSPSRWEIEDAMGIVLVLIPGGRYRLGAQSTSRTDPHHDPQARPEETVHEVELRPFFLSKYEMTRPQWERLVGRPQLGPGPTTSPAYEIGWGESVSLLGRLGLELPTEAQWEAAARAGTDTPWWTGVTERSLEGCANVADRVCQARFLEALGFLCSPELDDSFELQASVGSLRANAFGLHDVAGNVAEWCADPYSAPAWSARDGDGLRVVEQEIDLKTHGGRGGAWTRPAASARSADREEFEPGTRLRYLGVRPARPLAGHRDVSTPVALPRPNSGGTVR